MQIHSLTALKPMEVLYRHDDDINIPNYVTNFLYGLNLESNNLFNLAKDVSINYYNSFLLSEKFDKQDFITFSTPVSTSFPKKFSTTLQTLRLSAYGRGFWTDYTQNYSTSNESLSCGSSIFANGSIYNIGTWNIYEINLLNENRCTIGKLREVPPYLEQEKQELQYVDLITDQGLDFVVFKKINEGEEIPEFNYVYNRESNTIIFYRILYPIDNPNSASLLLLAQSGERIVIKSVDLNMVSESGLFNTDSVFLVSYRDADKRMSEFTTSLNEYKQYFFPTVNTNFSTSVTGLKNNYLISSDVLYEDNKFKINFQPLKNQLDVDYNFTKNSDFQGQEFNNRDYQTIVTGTNQELGLPDLTLTYYTYNAPLQFKKGALTYFHFPLSATPFVKLNINDTKLVDNGSFAGNNPLDSDKVFKKKTPTVKRDNIIDEQTGSYLCTWLYISSFDSRPIWLDRYYNPNFTNVKDAFINYAFINTVESLNKAENLSYFDKVSDLVFEPNATYSYYRISEKDLERANSTIKEKSVTSSYITTFDNEYNITRRESETIQIGNEKGTVFQTASSQGDLSISFNTKADSYKNKKGGIILSTYNGENGFVLSNVKQLNSFTFLTSGGEIYIYDSKFTLLERAKVYLNKDTFETPDKILSIDYDNIIDGYYITSCTTTGLSSTVYGDRSDVTFYVSKLNSNFITINTKTLTAFTGDNKGEEAALVSSFVDDKFYYALTTNINVLNINSEDQNYFITKFPISSFEDPLQDLSSYTSSISADLYPSNVNGISVTIDKGYFQNYNYTYNFCVSGYTPVYFITDYSPNSLILDVYKKPWYVFNKILFHSVTNIGSLSGFNMVYDRKEDTDGNLTLNSIDGITTDNNGNIYYITRNPNTYQENFLVKLDNKRVPQFKKPITFNSDSLSASHYIDIKYELINGVVEPKVVVVTDDYIPSPLSAGYLKTAQIFNNKGELENSYNITNYTDTINRSSKYQSALRRSLYNNQNIVQTYNLNKNLFKFDLYLTDTNNDKEVITFDYDISYLTNDDLFFTYTFDSRTGLIKLYINGVQVKTTSTDGIKYEQCEFTNNISINTLDFLPQILFKGFFNGGDLQFSRVSAYNKVLDLYDIRNLYLKDSKLLDMNWNVPAGRRNIQETIQHNFSFGLPQYKTNIFDLIINGTSALNEAQKTAISARIREYLKGNIPLNSNINKIEIRNN